MRYSTVIGIAANSVVRSMVSAFRLGYQRGVAREVARQRGRTYEAYVEGADAQTDRTEEGLEETFPASDPVSTYSGDAPPVNARAKWEAADADAKRRGLDVPTRTHE